MFGNKTKKAISVVLLVCFGAIMSGCTDSAILETEYGSPLLMSFSDFKDEYKEQKNSLVSFYNYKYDIPDSRTVDICFANLLNLSNNAKFYPSEIVESKIMPIDKEMGYAVRKCYPVDTILNITGTDSIDEILEKYGHPQDYTEYNGICAIKISRSDEYIIFYGDNNGGKMVIIDKEYKTTQNTMLQITDEAIYLFIKPNRDSNFGISVTKISIESSEVSRQFISFEEMNLPEIKGQILVNNIFIDDGIMYFSINDYGSNSWVTAYDFDSGKGNNIKIKCAYDGKLFKYESGVGLMVSCYDDEGYNTNMGLRFFNYDVEANKFTEREELSVTFPENARYGFYIDGAKFYCTNDTLCGIMDHINDGSYAYVEISLPDGEITTFMPFKAKKASHFPISYTVRENGAAVSPHNVK